MGTRQTESKIERRTAAFPEEIATRLVKMFSIKSDTMLDPFLGSGTTTKVAIECERNSVGYEINENLLTLKKRELALDKSLRLMFRGK